MAQLFGPRLNASHQTSRTPTYSYVPAPPEGYHRTPPIEPRFSYRTADSLKRNRRESERRFDTLHTQPGNVHKSSHPTSPPGYPTTPQHPQTPFELLGQTRGTQSYIPAPPAHYRSAPKPSPYPPSQSSRSLHGHDDDYSSASEGEDDSHFPSPPPPGPIHHPFVDRRHSNTNRGPSMQMPGPGMKVKSKRYSPVPLYMPALSSSGHSASSTQFPEMPSPPLFNVGHAWTGNTQASGPAPFSLGSHTNGPLGHRIHPPAHLAINPLISGATKSFPLLMDLRRGSHRVWLTTGCKPGSVPPEMDSSHRNALATTPMLHEMRIISPDHTDVLVVKNETGVTIDDVIKSICEHSAAAVSQGRWNTFSREHQQAIMSAYRANRNGPFAQYLLDEDDDRPLMVDTFVDSVCWGGLVTDPALVVQRFGGDDGRTFVSTLKKSWASWLDPEEAQRFRPARS